MRAEQGRVNDWGEGVGDLRVKASKFDSLGLSGEIRKE